VNKEQNAYVPLTLQCISSHDYKGTTCKIANKEEKEKLKPCTHYMTRGVTLTQKVFPFCRSNNGGGPSSYGDAIVG
jgi:hypothetical protein